MRICTRTRVMRLMSDRTYAYAYGRLYIYGPLALEIESIKSINKSKKHSKVTVDVTGILVPEKCYRSDVLVHSRRQFLRGVPSQFTEAHFP